MPKHKKEYEWRTAILATIQWSNEVTQSDFNEISQEQVEKKLSLAAKYTLMCQWEVWWKEFSDEVLDRYADSRESYRKQLELQEMLMEVTIHDMRMEIATRLQIKSVGKTDDVYAEVVSMCTEIMC